MQCILTLVMSFLIMTTAQITLDDIERSILVNVLNITNELDRLYEKHVLHKNDHYWKINEEPANEYDFIIVGGGSAGGVIANRLSEFRHWRILLLEAGQTEDALLQIPLIAGGFQDTSFDWQFRGEKQPNMCLGLEEKKMPCPRGKALGGSSVLNLMMYVRGNKWDYDQWEEEGNPGWSYEEILPYFKKSENARRVSNIDYRYHGKNGYLGIENSYRSLLTETFLDGAEEIGLPEIDYNAPTKSFGVSPLQATLWNGRRNSVARAFLHPIIHRNNLDIVIGAFVTKILINEETKEAYGVQYEKNNQSYTVLARKEVILSAGAINSPQLLILSGIGPKDHLNELGIKCIKDLPVGKNLQDHLTFYGVVYIIKFDYDQTYFRLATSVSDYVHFGEGPLTTVGGVEGVGFIKTSESTTEVDQPDIELMFIRSSIAADLGNWGKSAFKLTDEVYDSFFKPLQAKYHWSICPILLHPKTRGYLKLQSKDPYDQPLIYLKYLADPENKDVKTMIAGIRFIQKLANTTAFRKMGARLHDLSVHGCEEMVFDSDEYWECALRTMALTLYHLLGTAKMGPRGDPTAVVNNHLQVYGIHSLRVCDCSVIPNQISGHTNAIAIAIGEKCADYIKEYWRGR